MDSKEVELKLAFPPQAMERLKRHAVIKSHQHGRPSSQKLRSVYYDTPDRRLAQAGITVRVRSVGTRRLQTVKTAGVRASGLFSRREWETEIEGDGPDMEQLRSTGIPALQDAAILVLLEPLFATTVQRNLYVLRGDGWEVELALDQGEIVAGACTQPICEMELELREGGPPHLFMLAQHLTDAAPMRLLSQSKSDRGHDLAAARTPEAAKAKTVTLRVDTPVTAAFQAIARNCLHHLLANETALLDHGAPEAVHQMRVALRRLRSALKIFRPLIAGPEMEEATRDLPWLLGALGPARDAHVFLIEIIDPAVEGFPACAGAVEIQSLWQGRRDLAQGAAMAAVRDPRFTALLLALGRWVEAREWQPGEAQSPTLPVFASAVLAKWWRRMRRAAGRDLRHLDSQSLHQVRIMGKRLRYAGEFFAPLYGKSVRDFLADLARLQDKLGEINDLAVARPRLTQWQDDPRQAWAAGMVAGWHEARSPALLADAQALWKGLRDRKPGWKN